MAKQKIDALPEFRANLPRTGHTLSHDFSFTCTTAHLLPVFHDLLNPGETVKLNFDFNLRTMPLEAAAFDDLLCTTEYFFVPMPLLYQPFGSTYYAINDNFSVFFNTNTSDGQVHGYFPVADFDTITRALNIVRANDVTTELVGSSLGTFESIGQSACRFLDHLGFDPSGIAYGPTPQNLMAWNPNVFPYQILAYNCIYQYYYRLDNRELFNPALFNVDAAFAMNTPFSLLPKQLLLRYRPLNDDYFSSAKPSPLVDITNLGDGGMNQLVGAQDWLSANTNISAVRSAIAQAGVPTSDLPFTTLQQQIGSAGNTGVAVYPTPSSTDYSRIVGGNNSPQALREKVADLDGQGSYFAVIGSDQSSASPNANLILQSPHTHSIGALGSALNTANIRALFASEKLWAITGRARKNYDDQTLAHFGFKVPHDVKHQISCFGKDTSIIHIGEVISTANTGSSGSPLGEIAGKGYASQRSEPKSFTAPCHGVIMVIFSVVTQRNYEAGVMKCNIVTDRYDLYQPEYDHLGMQPIFGYEAISFNAANGNYDPLSMGDILGWQYRYEQWKRRYNRTTGAFKNAGAGGSLRGWIPTFEPPMIPSLGYNEPTWWWYMNMPSDVNQLFLGQYPKTWSTAYESNWYQIYDHDPFVVNSHINCVKVSTMSDYSLPRLDA